MGLCLTLYCLISVLSLSTDVGQAGRTASGSAKFQSNPKAHPVWHFVYALPKVVPAVPESQPGSIPWLCTPAQG